MSDARENRYLEMIEKIDADIAKLQEALLILNQVWIGKPQSDTGLFQAIKEIGGEIALLQRKRVEGGYYMNLPTESPPSPKQDASGILFPPPTR